MNHTWPDDAPHPLHALYMLFKMQDGKVYPLAATSAISETEAAARFEEKHGQPPEHKVQWQGYLWLGPLPKEAEA